MNIVKINYDSDVDRILVNRLQNLANERGVFKPDFKRLEDSVRKKEMLLLIILDANNSILGYTILLREKECESIMIGALETFKKKNGVGTYIVEYLKKSYSCIKAEALKTAIGFYLKNGFKIEESSEYRDLVVWTKSH
jgi:hypothetical protein